MVHHIDLELIPGVKPQPLFASDEEYQKFRLSWQETVVPELERLDELRRRSWEECANRPPLRT